jgi:hypothetical protein
MVLAGVFIALVAINIIAILNLLRLYQITPAAT